MAKEIKERSTYEITSFLGKRVQMKEHIKSNEELNRKLRNEKERMLRGRNDFLF